MKTALLHAYRKQTEANVTHMLIGIGFSFVMLVAVLQCYDWVDENLDGEITVAGGDKVIYIKGIIQEAPDGNMYETFDQRNGGKGGLVPVPEEYILPPGTASTHFGLIPNSQPSVYNVPYGGGMLGWADIPSEPTIGARVNTGAGLSGCSIIVCNVGSNLRIFHDYYPFFIDEKGMPKGAPDWPEGAKSWYVLKLTQIFGETPGLDGTTFYDPIRALGPRPSGQKELKLLPDASKAQNPPMQKCKVDPTLSFIHDIDYKMFDFIPTYDATNIKKPKSPGGVRLVMQTYWSLKESDGEWVRDVHKQLLLVPDVGLSVKTGFHVAHP